MENASKALIIAGAILISILIISFGVIILGQGSDVVNNADMSDSEKMTFNSKFEVYEGDNVKANKIKQMAKAVASHNRTVNDSNKQVWVFYWKANDVQIAVNNNTYEALESAHNCSIVKNTGDDGLVGLDTFNSGKSYKIKCVYDNNSGLVKAISVTINS